MKTVDVLFINVPALDTDSPLQAPAILKAEVEKHGFKASTYDFNLKYRKLLKSEPNNYSILRNFFSYNAKASQNNEIVTNFINECIEDIFKKFNIRFLGISIFAYTCQRAGELIASAVKKKNPSIKIFMGGQGLGTSGIKANKNYAIDLKARGIINDYISSEGEISVVKYLQNILNYTGINTNNWIQAENLDQFQYPNYSDYNLSEYDQKKIMITGSRGCVRRCTFCDIHTHWKKFVFRSGESIVDEIIYQHKKHNVTNFGFTDSLVNGSMKAYRDFVSKLAKYNKTLTNKITWSGQFIIRGINQMNAEDWKNTALSGANGLAIGVESGSEKIRNDMEKKFSDRDMDEFLEQAYINNVKLTLLMLVGYPTETLKDFELTIKFFKKYQKYLKIISRVTLGTTLGILPGTRLLSMFENDIDVNHGENFWTYKKNTELDFKERIRRRIILGELCESLGYNVPTNLDNIKFLFFLWNVYKNQEKQQVVDVLSNNLSDQKYS